MASDPALALALPLSEVNPADPGILALMDAQQSELEARYQKIDPDRFDPATLKKPRCATFAVFDGEIAVACGAIKPMSETCAEVKRMYTAPSHRGRGLAARILRRLLARASDLGFNRVHLTTGSLQPDAIAMYAKAGFQRTPPYGVSITDIHANCFELDLLPGGGAARAIDCSACANMIVGATATTRGAGVA